MLPALALLVLATVATVVVRHSDRAGVLDSYTDDDRAPIRAYWMRSRRHH